MSDIIKEYMDMIEVMEEEEIKPTRLERGIRINEGWLPPVVNSRTIAMLRGGDNEGRNETSNSISGWDSYWDLAGPSEAEV